MSTDRRCFRYRQGESRLFNSPEEVPEGEGWVDSPAKVEEATVTASDETETAPKKRGRQKKDANNGDSSDAGNASA